MERLNAEGYWTPWNGCYVFTIDEFFPSQRHYFNNDGMKYSCIVKKDGKYGVFKVMPTMDYGCSGLLSYLKSPICYDDIKVITTSICRRQDSVIVLGRRQNVWDVIDMSCEHELHKIACCKTFEEAYERVVQVNGFGKGNIDPEDIVNDECDSRSYNREYTPDKITSLGKNEIFVFGSNIRGRQIGGAANYAHRHFGAEWGVGEGITGNSYALPTMEGGIDYVRGKVITFLSFASQHPELKFYVTLVGCGIAGFTPDEIGPLFADAGGMDNVILPKEFVEAIERQTSK